MKMNKREEREERLKYMIKDSAYDRIDYIKITKDQLRLLEWLINNNYLLDVDIEEVGEIGYEVI
jgi:hypothetical protein